MIQPPQKALLRLKQIIGDPKATPPIPAIIPVSKSWVWAAVKAGTFPQPIKLGGAQSHARCTFWRSEDIRRYIESAGGSHE